MTKKLFGSLQASRRIFLSPGNASSDQQQPHTGSHHTLAYDASTLRRSVEIFCLFTTLLPRAKVQSQALQPVGRGVLLTHPSRRWERRNSCPPISPNNNITTTTTTTPPQQHFSIARPATFLPTLSFLATRFPSSCLRAAACICKDAVFDSAYATRPIVACCGR